jgi:prolyl 4-hydroxylase
MIRHAAHQVVTEELRRWIVAQAEAGCRPEDVIGAMRASGWDESVAIDAMESTLRARLDAVAQQRAGEAKVAAAAVPVPEPDLADAPHLVLPESLADDAQAAQVRVLLSLREPRLVVFQGLLSDDECVQLRALAAPRLLRSETVDTSTGGSEVNAARTSDGMFFERAETALIERIERRISALLRWPAERGEGLQILRYRPGAEYRPHHDYFDPAAPGSSTLLERGGQRVATVVMYLNTPERGGATIFPDLTLEVSPLQGHAVFFAYDRPHPATRTLHGGAPVLAGEKWVATKWLRERRFV